MSKRSWGLIVGISAAGLALSVNCAFAQSTTQVGGGLFSRDNSDSVLTRPRPDFDAIGVPLGAFLAFPKLDVTEVYDDNIFTTPTNAKTDWVTTLSPSVSLESQWSRNSLSANLHASTFDYSRYDSENDTTYGASLRGRLDVQRGTSVSGGASFDHLIDPRSDTAAPANAKNPIEYDHTSADVDASHEVDRIRVSGNFHFNDYNYKNGQAIDGSVLNQSYRDYRTYEEQVRADYAISPALALYTTFINDDFKFPNHQAGDVKRDSSNSQLDVGVDFELSHLIRAQLQAGYLWASFDQPGVSSPDGLALLGTVEYYPTQLITLTVNGQRSIQASGVIGSPATTTTTAGVKADYELLRNLILTASLQGSKFEYEGINRTDKDWSGQLRVNYLISRRLGLNAIYTYFNQNSAGATRGLDFSDNRFQVGLVVQY